MTGSPTCLTALTRRVMLAGLVLFGSGLGGDRVHAADPTPVAGGTLLWAYVLRPSSLDPNVWSGSNDQAVMRQIFDPLVWSPKPGEYQPGLATSWTVSSDGLVYTFELRHDVTFQDGTPFNADAVKLMFDRIADPASKSLMVGAIGPFDRAEVLDPDKVAIHLKKPWGAFMANVSSVALSPVSPAAIAKYGATIAQNPVGTGPFAFDKWVGNDLYLKRNPAYRWGPPLMVQPGAALIDELIIKEVPEASTRMNALRSGEVNLTHFPVLSELAGFERAGFQVDRFPQPGFVWCFPLNVTKAPTDDVRVRQAILYSINRAQVVKSVMFGQVSPAYGPLTKVTFGYDAAVEKLYPYDLKMAGELLDAAGWKLPPGGKIREKSGVKLHIDIAMFDTGPNKAISELTQAMLQQAGFDATLSVTNYPAFAAVTSANNYNLSEMRWAALDPDQALPTMFNSGQITGGGQFNRTRIADPALDKMIADAGASTDIAVRKQLYSKVQMMAMDDAWIAPIFNDVFFWLSQPKVHGMHFDLEGRPFLHDVWMQK